MAAPAKPNHANEEAIDKAADGAKNELNEKWQAAYKKMPEYEDESVQTPGEHKGNEGMRWKVTCTAIDDNGKKWVQSATRDGKKLGGNVAAYLVIKQLKDAGVWAKLG